MVVKAFITPSEHLYCDPGLVNCTSGSQKNEAVAINLGDLGSSSCPAQDFSCFWLPTIVQGMLRYPGNKSYIGV